jgi:hypothetical protein
MAKPKQPKPDARLGYHHIRANEMTTEQACEALDVSGPNALRQIKGLRSRWARPRLGEKGWRVRVWSRASVQAELARRLKVAGLYDLRREREIARQERQVERGRRRRVT